MTTREEAEARIAAIIAKNKAKQEPIKNLNDERVKQPLSLVQYQRDHELIVNFNAKETEFKIENIPQGEITELPKDFKIPDDWEEIGRRTETPYNEFLCTILVEFKGQSPKTYWGCRLCGDESEDYYDKEGVIDHVIVFHYKDNKKIKIKRR